MHPYYFENLFFDGTFVIVNIRDANNKDFCETVRLTCAEFLLLNRLPKSRAQNTKEAQPATLTNNARAKFSPDCCDESKQDLRDWIDCGFKFCPWCGRELRPIA